MSKIVNGWIARDKTGKKRTWFYYNHPTKDELYNQYFEGFTCELKKLYGLKPGQIKRATVYHNRNGGIEEIVLDREMK